MNILDKIYPKLVKIAANNKLTRIQVIELLYTDIRNFLGSEIYENLKSSINIKEHNITEENKKQQYYVELLDECFLPGIIDESWMKGDERKFVQKYKKQKNNEN